MLFEKLKHIVEEFLNLIPIRMYQSENIIDLDFDDRVSFIFTLNEEKEIAQVEINTPYGVYEWRTPQLIELALEQLKIKCRILKAIQ